MGRKRKIITKTAIIIFLILPSVIFGAKPFNETQPTEIVSMPTAGLIQKNNASFKFTFFEDGGINFALEFAPFNFLNLGLGYGGNNLIGEKKPSWNKKVDILCRLRLINESFNFPALLVGFNSQGQAYYDGHRYMLKSPGIFLVGSKNYYALGGDLSFHIGSNYSILEKYGGNSPDIFAGIIKELGPISLSSEYRTGFDESECEGCKKEIGYLNLSLAFSFVGNNGRAEIIFLDILNKNQYHKNLYRELRVSFTSRIF
ncbi:MAG: hypothetical protein ACPL6C_01320 [bacterium]